MYKFTLLTFFWLFTLSLLAQQITLKDATTLETLPGVVIESEGISVVTNERGIAQMADFKNKKTIQFILIGYEKYVFSYAQLAASNFEIYLFSSGLMAKEIVVSASKFEEKSADVPQQIAVIDRKQLQFQSSQTSADVLQQSGMVHVQKSQQGGGSPVLRGFEANKVMIVIDGVRMNNAIYRGGHLQDVITIDNSMLDKVEVSFGPSSVIYGSDALGGVMHFYTRQPKMSTSDKTLFEGGVMTRFATANRESTQNINFNLGGKKWAYLFNGSYSSFDDLRQGAGAPDQWLRKESVVRINQKDSVVKNANPLIQLGSGYQQFDMLHKVSFKPNSNYLHVLSYQHSASSNIPRYDRLTQIRNGAYRFAEWYYGPQERKQLTYHLHLNRGTQMYDQGKITAAYQHLIQSRHNRRLGKSELENQTETVQVGSINADFTKELQGGSEIRYGVEFYSNDVKSEANTQNIDTGNFGKAATRYADGGSTFTGAAAYVTHSWEISPRLVLTDGVRFNHIRLTADFIDTTFFPFPFRRVEQDNWATTGSIGIVGHPSDTWKLSLLASTGFRAPNVDDLSKVFESVTASRDDNGQLTSLGSLIIPNPNLKPEFTYNLDAGINKTFNKKASLSFNGFYTLYRDAITTDFTTLNGESIVLFGGDSSYVITSVNKSKAFIYGGFGQIIYQITKFLELNSSITYTKGRIDENNERTPLDHIPPTFGRTGLSCQFNKMKIEFWSMYNATKPISEYRLNTEDNEANALPEGMPGWYTLNIRGAYQINKHLRAQLAIENILDANYRLFASNISAPGRNIAVTLRATL